MFCGELSLLTHRLIGYFFQNHIKTGEAPSIFPREIPMVNCPHYICIRCALHLCISFIYKLIILCKSFQVLNACVQRKQWEGAFWVLQELKEKSLEPSVATYGLVMEVIVASSSFLALFFAKGKKKFLSCTCCLNFSIIL